MTTLVTSDIQMSEQRRDEYRWDFVEKTLPRLIVEHKANEVYVLGDCTELKDRHISWLVNRFCDSVCGWAQEADVVFLEGNHDRKDMGSPFFQFLRHVSHVQWISEPTSLGGRLFLPHTREPEYWPKINKDGASLIFAHNIFDGATAASGHKLRGIPTDVFPRGARVISGDVHEPQTIGCVTYVGSPYLCDFGDDYEPRVLLIDDTGKVKSIPVPGRNKRLIEIDSHDLNSEQFHRAQSGDIVKIRISIDQKDADRWQEIRDEINKVAEDHKLIVDAIQPVVAYSPKQRDATKHARKSDEDYVREYASRRGASKSTLDAGLDLIGD